MSGDKHTPGPWSVHQESIEPDWHIVTTVGGAIVANVSDRGEWGANAHLIAAAPDLLEALKNMLSKCGCGTALGCKVCDAARAAIAKAEGRS